MPILEIKTVPLSSGHVLSIIVFLVVLALLSMIFSLMQGSVEITSIEVFRALLHNDTTLANRVVMEIRLPRVIAGFLVGGMLALAGALMQVLLRNPLAEPYVLGISGGASVFALLAIISGMTGFWIGSGAFAGALISMLLVFVLSHSGGHWNPIRLLLTGIVIAAGWGAVISFLLALSPAAKVHGMLFWLMGDLAYATYSHWNGVILVAALFLSLFAARGLNLLACGDLQASALGVSVRQLRYFIYFVASLLTATAVMQAGSVGFIGLVIPHLVRLLLGSDHRLLLPSSVLLGGSLLVVADALARTIVAPQQLPVGILTAMIGVPIFLILMQTTSIRQKP